jgi:hydrogenase maturation protein HypF
MDRGAGLAKTTRVRVRYHVNGVVQGVGFRPFVYRIATEEGLGGTVKNGPSGVIIEVEGTEPAIASFALRLKKDLPSQARIASLESNSMVPTGEIRFQIIQSDHDGSAATLIPPDLATCDDCTRELFDSKDRRYRYPFINCTNCGPRYTIVRSIPYDRPQTSMSRFTMCPACQKEYDDPSDRRFHAQPNGCSICGPRVTLLDSEGATVDGEPVEMTIVLLRQGKILAIRGVGGFHLAVDASNDAAVRLLRQRKGRAEKPLALMAPDIEMIERYCNVSDEEKKLLQQTSRPIVLLSRKETTGLAESVAPNQQYLGFMLPYTPLQHLLLRGNFDALVTTSGNFAEEPIAIGNQEALERLSSMADYFLLHDREILQRCDDSIVRLQAGSARITRRSRGYVPLPIMLSSPTSIPILAVGGEMKNTIALSRRNEVFLSQHIGDLDNPSAMDFFKETITHLEQTLEIIPEGIAFDLHPEYLSTQWAQKQPIAGVSVQHHHAHLASVLAENRHIGKAIGIILDGTGYGTDGTIWGGELLVGDASSYDRFAWLEPTPMPGGSLAIQQPWRMAIAHLCTTAGNDLMNLDLPIIKQHASEIPLLSQMMQKKINSPLTSSCGRLFDAVSALIHFERDIAYEAQAAIELEMLCSTNDVRNAKGYLGGLSSSQLRGPISLSFFFSSIVDDLKSGKSKSAIAAEFHRTIVELWLKAAMAAREQSGLTTVALSGGVYQNSILFELMIDRLTEEQFTVLTHHQVPTNDGGLALGQIAVADTHFRLGRS